MRVQPLSVKKRTTTSQPRRAWGLSKKMSSLSFTFANYRWEFWVENRQPKLVCTHSKQMVYLEKPQCLNITRASLQVISQGQTHSVPSLPDSRDPRCRRVGNSFGKVPTQSTPRFCFGLKTTYSRNICFGQFYLHSVLVTCWISQRVTHSLSWKEIFMNSIA